MLSRSGSTVTLEAPATVGNFGPGFDVMSLALAGLGDTIHLSPADEDRIEVTGPGAGEIPTAWRENVAGRCLDRLRETTGVDACFEVTLEKPRGCGSGLGSSASSAAGVALAFHALDPDAGLEARTLVEAAGRADAAGTPHFDDVAAVVLGGLALVDPTVDGLALSRVPPPEGLHLALAVPDLVVETHEMRDVLPETVRLEDAVANLAAVARLVDACHTGDVETVGACLGDRLAAPHRIAKLAIVPPARKAAQAAGALGSALAGSGPSIVAACKSQASAERVAEAMCEAVREHEIPAKPLTARPEHEVPYDVASMR